MAANAASTGPAPPRDFSGGTKGRLIRWTVGLVLLVATLVVMRTCETELHQLQFLPDGVVLKIPPHGAEARLIDVLEDPARPTDDRNWILLDKLAFAEGSGTPEGSLVGEQLDHLAAILVAWPDARLKIGGHANDGGEPAADERLAVTRAEAVMAELTRRGIAAERLEAVGYGAAFPVADARTVEGQARNRRVEILVTAR